MTSTLYANMALLRVQTGIDRTVGRHPELIEAASQGIKNSIEENGRKIQRYASWQFGLLIVGAAFFVAWHIVEMYQRTF